MTYYSTIVKRGSSFFFFFLLKIFSGFCSSSPSVFVAICYWLSTFSAYVWLLFPLSAYFSVFLCIIYIIIPSVVGSDGELPCRVYNLQRVSGRHHSATICSKPTVNKLEKIFSPLLKLREEAHYCWVSSNNSHKDFARFPSSFTGIGRLQLHEHIGSDFPQKDSQASAS